jgi:hypothetical protein
MKRIRLSIMMALVFLLVAIPVGAQMPDDNTLVVAQSVDVGALEPALVGSRAEAISSVTCLAHSTTLPRPVRWIRSLRPVTRFQKMAPSGLSR